MLAALGKRDSTKVLGTDPSHWEQIYGEFSDAFEQPGTPPRRAIKHEINLLPDSEPLAKR